MYNKKVLSTAKKELNKAKAPKKPEDMITDRMGQWKYPGLPTRIPNTGSNDLPITMDGVYRPLLAIASTGEKKVLNPNESHTFRGAKYVDEYPQMRKGGVKKKKTKSLSGTNKIMLTHPLLRNYKNKVYDPNVDYFQDGGVKDNIIYPPGDSEYMDQPSYNYDIIEMLNQKARRGYEEYMHDQTDPTNINRTSPAYQQKFHMREGLIQAEDGGSKICPEGYIFDPKAGINGMCVPESIYKLSDFKSDPKEKKKEIEENRKYSDANEYMEDYYNSPKYKEMLKKSSKNDNTYNYFLKSRNKQLKNTPPLRILPQPADNPTSGGQSDSDTGQITIFPMGMGTKGTSVHELSHSSDRPLPFTERRLIPQKDIDYINEHKAKSIYDSKLYHNYKDYYENGTDSEKASKKKDLQKENENFQDFYSDYVGNPTETRARLNAIRQGAKENNLYDPFTEGVSPDTYYKKLKNFKFETGDQEGFDPMMQLQRTYSDDEIQWMLNNISKKEDKNNDVPYAQDGGEYIETELTDDKIEEYIKGGYIVEDISVPELTQAQKGGTKTHKSADGTTTNTITKANGDVIIQVKTKDGKYTEKIIPAAQQKAWNELGKKLTIPYQKIPGSMGEAQQMMDSGELDYETWSERKARNIKEAEERKQARLKSLKDYEKRISNKKYNSLTGLPNEDWRELLANEAAPLGAKFRVSQEDNFFDDYLNPLVMIGSGAQSLGEAPKLAKESDSYMPYVSAIGSPLLTGALASVGANNTKQFVNNLFNPLASNKTSKYKEPDKIPLTLDDLKDKVAELKKIDKPDLDEGEKIFNSLKQESLDFWKTPEGKRRVQKYLDENGLSKNGITPEMYADMMSDIGYQNKTETLAMRDDLNKIKDARETLRSQRFEFSKQVWALKDAKANLIKSSNPTPEDINAIKDIDKQLNELENKISLNSDRDSKYVELEALKNVPEENAFYDIGKDKIFLGEDWSRPVNIEQSGYHEWGHAKNLKPHFELEKWFPNTYRKEKLTNQFDDYGNVSPLNKRLRESLEFENEKSGDIPEHLMQELNIEELYKNAQPISEFGLKRYTDPKSYYQTSRNYFNADDESNAYLQELLPELKKRGHINKQGDLISPQMVENLFKEYRSDAAKNIVEPIRLLDVVRPTERSVNRITDELNNLHNWMIGAGGAGAAGATLSDDDESKPELKKGGIVAELSDDEIQDYINQGYIVEEVDEPEMQSGGQMPYQIWEEKTGTPWSEAKRQGLTDGSYEQNVALAQKLLADVTSVVKENLESKPTFDYNKYDQIVSTLVQKGNTLEDLVAQQIGTKEGLMKRYPKLFSASNTKSKAVNTANIPVRSVDEILKRTPAPINLKTPQIEMKSETLQYQNVPVKKLNLISDSNLKPKPVSSTVKQFERSKKVNETKLKEAEFKNYVNTIRESLTPDSVKKQKQLQNSFFPTAPKKKLTVREPLTQETTQEFRDRMMKIQQGLNLKPIQTDTEKVVPIKNFQDLQGVPGKNDTTVNLPEVNGKEFPVKKPVVKVKPPQDITKIQNSFKPEMSFKKGSKLTEAKPETEEQVVKEDSEYKVISNLTNRVGSYDQSLQNLYYDYTNPKHSPEKRKQVKAAFDNKLKERNNLITIINSKKRDYAGVLDSWIDESAPAWVKKPAQKGIFDISLADQVEASSYKLPKFETYKEKEEKENEKFRTSKRFDDLGGNEKGSRWQFRVAASNDDPMKVQVYGTRSERNPDLNIKSKGAVMHFLDQSPLTGYVHPTTQAYYRDLKPDGFVGKLEKQKDGNYTVKYIPKKDIPAKDLHKNTFLVRQEKFDNIDFNKKVADRNFLGHTYWTKKGSTKATIPVSSGKDANVYDYSSGQSVVFIFPYKGKTRYVHFAGSPNAIKKEGEEIKKLYKLQANKLVLGVADAGSYSSSVKGNITDKKLKDWTYGYANTNGFTGAGMALVD